MMDAREKCPEDAYRVGFLVCPEYKVVLGILIAVRQKETYIY
jgi:hypothetical protein